VDRRITSALNVPGAFTSKVDNSANIGMSIDQIVDLWNEEHPADLIELDTSPEPQPQDRTTSLPY